MTHEEDLSFDRLLRELSEPTEEQQLKWFSSFRAEMEKEQ